MLAPDRVAFVLRFRPPYHLSLAQQLFLGLQVSVRSLARQVASLPEVFAPFNGLESAALLHGVSFFAAPEVRPRFDTPAPFFQRPEFACFRLKAACSACALATSRVSRTFARSAPTAVSCRAFSIPAPFVGFAPSEFVLAVSRTPSGSPCPSFCSSQHFFAFRFAAFCASSAFYTPLLGSVTAVSLGAADADSHALPVTRTVSFAAASRAA